MAMATGLDSILSFIVPIGIFIMFGFILWRAFGDELSSLFSWIKDMMGGSNTEQVQPPQHQYTNSNKNKNLYGWESGGIAYGN
jgi:hypothetical protein